MAGKKLILVDFSVLLKLAKNGNERRDARAASDEDILAFEVDRSPALRFVFDCAVVTANAGP